MNQKSRFEAFAHRAQSFAARYIVCRKVNAQCRASATLLITAAISPLFTLGQTNNAQSALKKTRWPQTNLNLLVLDHSGRPAPAAPGGIQLLEDGTPQAIQSISAGDDPVSLTLLIDDSPSVAAGRSRTIAASTALAGNLPPGSDVTVIRFNGGHTFDLRLARPSAVTPAIFTPLQSFGGTALFDALIAAATNDATHAHRPRCALVLLTDGEENASKHSLEEAERSMQTPSACMLYTLGLPPQNEQGVSHRQYDTDKKRMSDLTQAGGIFLYAAKDKDVLSAANSISVMIRSQFALTWTTTVIADGRLHNLDPRPPASESLLRVYGIRAYYAPNP